jgi:L-ascorbate metabolism protein UlaG (beta-lactamase superfamily)
MKFIWAVTGYLPVAVLTAMTTGALAADASPQGAMQVKGKYVNGAGPWKLNLGGAIKAQVTTEQVDKSPAAPIPLRQLTISELDQHEDSTLFRLGHSTVLLKLDGHYLLTDPVFSERASPVQWAGPRRFHQPPLQPTDLPHLKAVIISHDHYDHLDRDSIKALAGRVEYFVTPLGVGKHLRRWGVAEDAIIELDWWQEVELGSLTLAATPAQHFSGRGLLDRNETLWASWVIRSGDSNIFFSGDTGYFDGFREIGERYGPFDITMIENGAYNHAWRDIHMLPEDSIQAHLDLGGKAMLPIHNSTFDLSLHAWYEPMERVSALAAEHGIEILTPVIGAPVSVQSPQPTFAWWRAVEESEQLASGELAPVSFGGE